MTAATTSTPVARSSAATRSLTAVSVAASRNTGVSRLLAAAAPQLLQARVAPAAALVELVACRALHMEVLVIALGGIEDGGLRDLGDDLAAERLGLLQRGARSLRHPLLLV